MSYANAITRSQAEALIPDDVSREIIKAAPEQSVVMQLGRRLPNMTKAQRPMPVLNALISGGFVDGENGLKQTGFAEWKNQVLTAAEIAVIVPIPEVVLDDADYDIWGEIRPQIAAEFGRIFDAAVLYGTNKPADWPESIVDGAIGAGHIVAMDDVTGSGGDLYDAIMGEGGVLALVEADGFMVNGHAAAMPMKAKLRGLRDTNKQPIFLRGMQPTAHYELDGEPIHFPKNGAMDADAAWLISGDWSQLVWSVRQDLTYKVLDQAVITDAAGNIVYNLAQQDMVALRAVMRIAWQLPNPVTPTSTAESGRFPFAILAPTV